MAVIGPRPALWNQDDLIAERDKYGANDVKPGLTGWCIIWHGSSFDIQGNTDRLSSHFDRLDALYARYCVC